jgi:hypothetical protein
VRQQQPKGKTDINKLPPMKSMQCASKPDDNNDVLRNGGTSVIFASK